MFSSIKRHRIMTAITTMVQPMSNNILQRWELLNQYAVHYFINTYPVDSSLKNRWKETPGLIEHIGQGYGNLIVLVSMLSVLHGGIKGSQVLNYIMKTELRFMKRKYAYIKLIFTSVLKFKSFNFHYDQ